MPKSQSQPSVSLCTITRNRPELVALLARWICAQRYPKPLLEWVVVDDSDSAHPPDLAWVEEAGLRLVWRHLSERTPLGAKRNLCHELARGELLVLLDDDDYYPPTRVSEVVEAFARVAAVGERPLVAGCSRMPLLLLPEASRWLTPITTPFVATANTLAYWREFVADGHGFPADAWVEEEAGFLKGYTTPILQLDPAKSLTCIGHGANTVDKRLWIARRGQATFERLGVDAEGFPPENVVGDYCKALGLPLPSPPATPPEPEPPTTAWKVAVVTPYFNEPLEVLERCCASVQGQSVACTHVLVADGPGRPELDSWPVRHLRLGCSHGDNGNTPRGLGALLAMNEGYDCIAFLDADNWWRPDHLSAALACQAQGNLEVVFSDREIVFPDGQRLSRLPDEDQLHHMADTSAMVVFAPAFASLAWWLQMPVALAPQCDRVVFQQLMAHYRCGWSGARTLWFESWYAGHFLASGRLPPLNAKFLPLLPAQQWQEARDQFRQRCLQPAAVGIEALMAPERAPFALATILGPARSGGTLLQALLCRHLGFVGVPETPLMFQLAGLAAMDPNRRYPVEAWQEALATGRNEGAGHRPWDLRPLQLQGVLKPDRSYTLAEVTFAALQTGVSDADRELAKRYGRCVLVQRSSSLSWVTQELFASFPLHQVLLIVRDPVDQIAAVERMQRAYPEHWAAQGGPQDRWSLCRQYLEAVLAALLDAPAGHLKVVSLERLCAQPQLVLADVATFLRIPINLCLALEPCVDPAAQGGKGLSVLEQEAEAALQALPSRLLGDEPWKLHCVQQALAVDPWLEPLPPLQASPAWNDPQGALLLELLQPVRQCVAWLAGQAAEPWDGESMLLGDPRQQHLQDLVELVADGLIRRGDPPEWSEAG